MTKLGNDGHGVFFFLVDEEKFAFEDEWNTGDESTSGSCTINMQLTAGQIVRIENWQSTGIYGTESEGYMSPKATYVLGSPVTYSTRYYKDNYRGEGIRYANARPKVFIFWKSRPLNCNNSSLLCTLAFTLISLS